MVTSKQWWDEVKNDPSRFNDWLVKQYRGEVTAASRIEAFSKAYAIDDRSKKVLHRIAEQERTHAQWVLELLIARGIAPETAHAEDRYWSATLPEVESFEKGAAVGAHAEAMRLERITTICDDESAPADVRATFQRILKDEVWHESAFRKMAGYTAMAATQASHEMGRRLLGLEA